MEMADEMSILEAANLISRAGRLVAFSGAGMSAESGIPTFRDPGGLWDRYDAGELGGGDVFGSLLSGNIPTAAVDFISEMIRVLEKARPNPGHLALAELEQMGILKTVITQNIDNLHSEAGNTNVIEVHGNVYRLACLSCGAKMYLKRDELFGMGWEMVELMRNNDLPGIMGLMTRCYCGGISRLDVVGFGEPVQGLPEAIYESQKCDAFLILGTSGVVWPAASLPGHAKRVKAKVVEINATEICFPSIVDVGIIGKTGEVLPEIVERIRSLRSQ